MELASLKGSSYGSSGTTILPSSHVRMTLDIWKKQIRQKNNRNIFAKPIEANWKYLNVT